MGKTKKAKKARIKKIRLKKTVFLDRDGVISIEKPDYIKSWSEFQFLPKSKSAVRQLNRAGFLVIVITNQSAVGRGLMAEQTLNEINKKMQTELELADAHIDALYYCPHKPDDLCNCRKPKTGLIDAALKKNKIDLKKSWLVGDSIRHDVPLGKSFGLKTILVSKDKYTREEIVQSKSDYVVESLMEAVQIIKKSAFREKRKYSFPRF